MNNASFMKILFNQGEGTCFARDKYGWKVSPILLNHLPSTMDTQFFCINPLSLTKDNQPVAEWHRPDLPRRADVNVSSWRNFLIEIDSMPIEEQMAYINQIQMPFSTAVYSGGKSIHFILSLENGFTDRKEYDYAASCILNIVNKADKSAKNPSRLSRYPGHMRADKGQEQKLIHVGSRITSNELWTWIKSNLHEEPVTKSEVSALSTLNENLNRTLNAFTRNFIMFGAPQGERNSSLFKAACDAAKCGMSFDKFCEIVLDQIEELGEKEALATICSAYDRVELFK